MSLLEVQNLALRFPSPAGEVQALRCISFHIRGGEMLALVGESGSGKSLTALSILGLQPPQAKISGSVTLEGQTLLGAPDAILRTVRGKRVGMIFQEPMTALNPLHTIDRQIGEMLAAHEPRLRVDSAARRQRVLELLAQVGMPDFGPRLASYPHQLSGGQRQRVMIAMAIANQPDLLIADEPTTAVDVTLQVKIMELLRQLQREMNMAILFITHDLTLVRKLADRVAVMSKGEIVEQGEVETVFARPAHPYTRQLLESQPGDPPPSVTTDATLIECEDLRVHFPIRGGVLRRQTGVVKAVDGITLKLRAGETLGVVGESGSGKSSLGFALLRLLASEGRIAFDSQEIQDFGEASMRPLRRQMQVVFQDPFSSLNPRMTVQQILEEGLKVQRPEASAGERLTLLEDILADTGLSPDMLRRYPHAFSGGQRQRISIARAMVLRPRFVMLDEPTSALDLTVQAQIVNLLKDLQQKYDLAYLFISHDLRVVRAMAHRVLVMQHGQAVEEGPAERIFTHPEKDYTKLLVNAAYFKD